MNWRSGKQSLRTARSEAIKKTRNAMGYLGLPKDADAVLLTSGCFATAIMFQSFFASEWMRKFNSEWASSPDRTMMRPTGMYSQDFFWAFIFETFRTDVGSALHHMDLGALMVQYTCIMNEGSRRRRTLPWGLLVLYPLLLQSFGTGVTGLWFFAFFVAKPRGASSVGYARVIGTLLCNSALCFFFYNLASSSSSSSSSSETRITERVWYAQGLVAFPTLFSVAALCLDRDKSRDPARAPPLLRVYGYFLSFAYGTFGYWHLMYLVGKYGVFGVYKQLQASNPAAFVLSDVMLWSVAVYAWFRKEGVISIIGEIPLWTILLCGPVAYGSMLCLFRERRVHGF